MTYFFPLMVTGMVLCGIVTWPEVAGLRVEHALLHVADVERSITFYSRIPGAQLVLHRPHEFARLLIGTGSLHLVQLPLQNRFHIELDTEDAGLLYKQLCEAGLTPASPPKHHPWGKIDFRLVDPDGYQLEFGTMDADA